VLKQTFITTLFLLTLLLVSSGESNSLVKAKTANVSSKANDKSSANLKSVEKTGVQAKVTQKTIPELMADLRDRIKTKKYNWDLSLFHDQGWLSNGYSVNGQPLIYWTCGSPNHQNASLILSAVHGDEVTPVYYGFRVVEYLKARPELCNDAFIVVAPIVNPDGFLRYKSGTRSNFNKVDLNRNFDTPDWHLYAHKLWRENYKGERRYFPGTRAASEPETVFQAWLVENFKPVKILSVHSPLDILDYDGPKTADALKLSENYLKSLRGLKEAVKKATPSLKYFEYGHFPGSLGNFAGKQRGIPTLTAELPTADAQFAAYYFGLIEEGTRIFIQQRITDSPIRSTASIDN
jgi:protein MpaA